MSNLVYNRRFVCFFFFYKCNIICLLYFASVILFIYLFILLTKVFFPKQSYISIKKKKNYFITDAA